MIGFVFGSIASGLWKFFTGSWWGFLLGAGCVLVLIVKFIDGR